MTDSSELKDLLKEILFYLSIIGWKSCNGDAASVAPRFRNEQELLGARTGASSKGNDSTAIEYRTNTKADKFLHLLAKLDAAIKGVQCFF